MCEDGMATRTQSKIDHLLEDDTTSTSVYPAMYVDFDNALVTSMALTHYVKVKLNTVAPWLVHSPSYQSAFEEAYQLCQSSYDFNLILYDQPVGHYISRYEPAKSFSVTDHHRVFRTKSRLRRYWQRIWKLGRQRVPCPKYHNEILMVPGKRKWIEVYAGRFIIVPEGILRCNPANFAL